MLPAVWRRVQMAGLNVAGQCAGSWVLTSAQHVWHRFSLELDWRGGTGTAHVSNGFVKCSHDKSWHVRHNTAQQVPCSYNLSRCCL